MTTSSNINVQNNNSSYICCSLPKFSLNSVRYFHDRILEGVKTALEDIEVLDEKRSAWAGEWCERITAYKLILIPEKTIKLIKDIKNITKGNTALNCVRISVSISKIWRSSTKGIYVLGKKGIIRAFSKSINVLNNRLLMYVSCYAILNTLANLYQEHQQLESLRGRITQLNSDSLDKTANKSNSVAMESLGTNPNPSQDETGTAEETTNDLARQISIQERKVTLLRIDLFNNTLCIAAASIILFSPPVSVLAVPALYTSSFAIDVFKDIYEWKYPAPAA
ncbi:MAG: hypothetical protein Tsb0021_17490 [Chlamydiales bacterium]